MSDSEVPPLQDSFRSDDLQNIRSITEELSSSVRGDNQDRTDEQLTDLLDPYQVDLVIDANVAIKEIYFLVEKREKPDARTAIQECVDAGTVNLYGPDYLEEEVREKIPKIAHNHDVDADQLFAQWEEYKTYVDFRKVSDEEIEAVRRSVEVTDEDDLPFVALQVDLGSLLTSDDDHVRDMGEAVPLKAIMALRDYSRAATVEHHLKVGGIFLGVLTLEAMRGAWRGLVSAASAFRKLPRWGQFGVLLILAAAVLHPKSREMILSGLSSVTSLSREALRKMAPVVKQAINEIEEAEREIERFEESQFHPDESAVVPHGGNDTGGDARLFLPPPIFHVAEFTRPPRLRKPSHFESLRPENTSSVEDATLPLLDVTVRGIQD